MAGILKNQSLSKFLEKNSSNEILELLLVLLKDQKKEWLEIFTNSIRSHVKTNPNVITITKNQFKDLEEKILNLKIDKKYNKLLSNHKNSHEIKWNIKRKFI